MPYSKTYRWFSVLLLALYLPLIATLDLHHNHDPAHCCEHSDEAHLPALDERHEHAPCPVLLLTLAHAPLLTLELPTVERKEPCVVPPQRVHASLPAPDAAGRSPPLS